MRRGRYSRGRRRFRGRTKFLRSRRRPGRAGYRF